MRAQADFGGDVFEMVVTEIFVQDGILEALGEEMAVKTVLQADILAVGTSFVGGVLADVADEEIEKAVIVVVEEESAGGMGDEAEAGFLGDVGEMAVAVVVEQDIAAAHGGDEEVRETVVINVRKSSADADPAGQADAGFLGDVLEFSTAEILPELVAADLVDEINVVEAVAINVSNGDAGAVVVVIGAHVAGNVVHGVVDESNAALFEFVGEVKLVEDFELFFGGELGLFSGSECFCADVLIRVAEVGLGGGLASGLAAGLSADASEENTR